MSPCFVLLLVLPLVASQNFEFGRCPSAGVQANFSMDEFLGRWYTIIQTQEVTAEDSECRCVSTDLVRQMDHSVLITVTPKPKHDYMRMDHVLYEGMAEPAKMEHHMITHSELLNALIPVWDIWILETDYTNMAVVYSCMDILDMCYIEMAWILSRERTLPSQMVRKALDLLEREGIDTSLMMEIDQSDCERPAAEDT